MIRVEPASEPEDFDARVRQPGRAALLKGTRPSLWRKCLDELWARYNGVCAYSAFYIDPITGARSVEHFAAKSTCSELAYEWTNYRLVSNRLNGSKSHFADVLDPFEIQDGWFVLEFGLFGVAPAATLDPTTSTAVRETIGRLKLDSREFRAARISWYENWAAGHFSDELMRKRAPFIYREAIRQGMVPKIEPQSTSVCP